MSRSSRPEVFCKNGVLRNFTKFAGKHLCQSFGTISVDVFVKLHVAKKSCLRRHTVKLGPGALVGLQRDPKKTRKPGPGNLNRPQRDPRKTGKPGPGTLKKSENQDPRSYKKPENRDPKKQNTVPQWGWKSCS